MSVILITDDTMKKLKCDLCNNYLSYFPIYVSNGKNICGRFYLHPQEESNLHVDKAFQTLAELIEFPCQYEKEGCFEKCFPKNIIEHEKKCDYRTVKCPTRQVSACNWEGALPTVLDHCQNKHNDLILKNGNFELNLAETYQHENLLQHDSALFIVSQNFTSLNKLIKINIRYPDYVSDIKENLWKITFETTNSKLEIRIHTQSFEDHKDTKIYLDNFVDDADSYEMEVKGKIIVDKKIENKPEFSEEKNDEFLALLICSSCSNYALPPIYEVTISDRQTEKNIKCSACRSKLENKSEMIRNHTLDKLVEKLIFPCENEINGCTFKSRPSVMSNHHLTCFYRDYDCPVSEFISCNWWGPGNDIAHHIKQIHFDITRISVINLSFNKYFCVENGYEMKEGCYILKFSNRFFRLNFFKFGREFHFVCQLIGPNENNLFYYEVEIINENEDKESSLRTRLPCLALMKKEDLLKTKYCCFHYNQIKHVFPNFPIIFCIKIFKL